MPYLDIRHAINNITSGRSLSADIAELLFKHKCYYMLSKIALPKKLDIKLKATLAFIELSHKARYFGLTCILNKIYKYNYAIVKGCALSQMAYSSESFRNSLDVDLLVHTDQLSEIKDIFFTNNFVQGYVEDDKIVTYRSAVIYFYALNSHQLAPFITKTGNNICPYINVDLNFNIFWGESKKQADMSYVLQHVVEGRLYGHKVKILSPEMALVALCLHHYKDLNSIYLISRGSIRLNLFADLFYLIVNSDLSSLKCLDFAIHLECCPYVFYCLYFCKKIFTHKKIDALYKVFEPFKDDNMINSYGLIESERKQWTFDFFDRLFNDDFLNLFVNSLTLYEKNKIEINDSYLNNL